MTVQKKLTPAENELPSHYADRIGLFYTKTVTQKHKKENGQFFTPIEIAALMASLSKSCSNSIKILDPGCGTAILSCCLIENLVQHSSSIELIELVAYEMDIDLIKHSEDVLSYTKKWLQSKGIIFSYVLHIHDFILENAIALNESELIKDREIEQFDIIISNPPYFKLSKEDERTKAAKAVVSGQPNIYSIFMAIAAKLLKNNGELIFITPRSFASGNYFKAFREFFFSRVELERIHLFVSRKDTFNRDNVLQETVIIKAVKSNKINKNKEVLVSSSHSLKDIIDPSFKYFELKHLIDFDTNEKILHLPINDKEENIMKVFRNWNGNLHKYSIQISTGPVVSFRAWVYIQDNYENGVVFLAPLFWLHNVNKMSLNWPAQRPNKGQYIRILNESKSILIPNKNYIFLRRFSSKDDKSRLIAAPYFCNYIKSEYIGVENKVNYIYRPKGNLERNEVVGLCALLNSELFDDYFRIFNGNVNVSATELREISLPPLESIKEIGNQIILSNDYSFENTNNIVNEYFEIKSLIPNYE